jgi:hypothetical protein
MKARQVECNPEVAVEEDRDKVFFRMANIGGV